MTQRRKPPVKASNAYPPQFGKLLDRVGREQVEVVINTLGNERKYYTSFRARINEFRRAFYDEALASGDPLRIERAELFYSVTIEDPKQVDGKWQCVVKPKSKLFANAIDEALGEEPTESMETIPISQLLGGDDD